MKYQPGLISRMADGGYSIDMKSSLLHLFLLLLFLIYFSCQNAQLNKPAMLTENLEDYLHDYLKDRYKSEFEVLRLERTVTEADFKVGNTVTAYIIPKDQPDQEFVIFVNEKPEFSIQEDRYPHILLQEYLKADLDNEFDFQYEIVPKLSFINQDLISKIHDIETAGELFKQQEKSFWYIYISIIPKDEELNDMSDAVHNFVETFKNKGLRKIFLEFIFYDPDTDLNINDLKYDLNASFSDRYAQPDAILETWVGQVGKKEYKDYSKRFRKMDKRKK